jgi:hypothetical protein
VLAKATPRSKRRVSILSSPSGVLVVFRLTLHEPDSACRGRSIHLIDCTVRAGRLGQEATNLFAPVVLSGNLSGDVVTPSA